MNERSEASNQKPTASVSGSSVFNQKEYLFDRARIENKSVKSVIKFLIRSHSTEKEKRFKYDIGV